MVVGIVGAAVTGRQDLPGAFRFLGTQIGRVVGLLQGARARVDQYAAQNELRQLQNELRSGLRELDQVRMELAVAASSQGIVGRTLGATTPSANRVVSTMMGSRPSIAGGDYGVGSMTGSSASLVAATSTSTSPSTAFSNNTARQQQTLSLDRSFPMEGTKSMASLASHSEKAALEDEWEKQGIGYQTRAEQLYKLQRSNNDNNNNRSGPIPASGSELLEGLIKQSLLWDQYDRVVGEQDSELQNRIEAIKEKRNTNSSGEDNNSDKDK